MQKKDGKNLAQADWGQDSRREGLFVQVLLNCHLGRYVPGMCTTPLHMAHVTSKAQASRKRCRNATSGTA